MCFRVFQGAMTVFPALSIGPLPPALATLVTLAGRDLATALLGRCGHGSNYSVCKLFLFMRLS